MNHVIDSVRNSSVMHGLRQQRRGGWSFFRGLNDHRVPASQRRRDFPGEQKQRKVPRRNDSNHAQRLAHSVIQSALSVGSFSLKRFQSRHLDEIGKDSKICCRARYVQLGCQAHRLPGVCDFCFHETIKSRLNCGTDPMQSLCSVAHTQTAPFRVQRASGRADRFIDLALVGFRNLRNHRTIRRIHIRELLLPAHELAINVVQD